MLHHTGDPVCPSCENKLTQAHPDLQDWFRKDVKLHFPTAHISWSYRNQADQEQAFTEGKSHAHYPKSPHNKTAQGLPCSEALDLFELSGGQAAWPYAFFASINQWNQTNQRLVKWGGQFKSLGDFDHFQIIFPF